jgi:three-Cys-motif partner protein
MAVEELLGFDDNLPLPEVGSWSESKYRLLHLYDSLFSTGMKFKWDERVYIDLYAGAGFSRIRNTTRVLLGSPLIALSVNDPFDKYIFCEKDEELLSALRVRSARHAPLAKIEFVLGDCNDQVDAILQRIPRGSKDYKVLGLCFVDPFDVGIRFDTIQRLAVRYLDFLCLLALHMDANRNYTRYIDEQSDKIDLFLGTPNWRGAWVQAQSTGISFPKFLAEQFAMQMQKLSYIPPPFYAMREVRSDDKNLPLYHLALFSRSQLAYRYWDEVLKYSDDQLHLF